MENQAFTDNTDLNTFIVAVYFIKGGVAKTTTCIEFAVLCAEAGKKVCCLDLDSQGNLSKLLNRGKELLPFAGNSVVKGTYEILTESIPFESVARRTDYPELGENQIDYVPSGANFRKRRVVKELYEEAGRAKQIFEIAWDEVKQSGNDIDIAEVIKKYNVPERYRTAIINGNIRGIDPTIFLKNWIEQLRGKYDLIFLDVNPTSNLISDSALAAADSLISPSFFEGFSEDCLGDLVGQINYIKDNYNNHLQFQGILGTNVATNTKITVKTCEDLWNIFVRSKTLDPKETICDRVIRRDNLVNESNTTGIPLAFMKAKSKALVDYIYAIDYFGLAANYEGDREDVCRMLERHGIANDKYEFFVDPAERKAHEEKKKQMKNAIDKEVAAKKKASGKFGVMVKAITEEA